MPTYVKRPIEVKSVQYVPSKWDIIFTSLDRIAGTGGMYFEKCYVSSDQVWRLKNK